MHCDLFRQRVSCRKERTLMHSPNRCFSKSFRSRILTPFIAAFDNDNFVVGNVLQQQQQQQRLRQTLHHDILSHTQKWKNAIARFAARTFGASCRAGRYYFFYAPRVDQFSSLPLCCFCLFGVCVCPDVHVCLLTWSKSAHIWEIKKDRLTLYYQPPFSCPISPKPAVHPSPHSCKRTEPLRGFSLQLLVAPSTMPQPSLLLNRASEKTSSRGNKQRLFLCD